MNINYYENKKYFAQQKKIVHHKCELARGPVDQLARQDEPEK